jgi:TonB-linked SusC/RagA family outer membrane protein
MRNLGYSTHQAYEQPAARSALSGKTLLLALFLPIIGHAQTAREVSGKVTDATGTGLPGVTVLVTGTSVGASTGADGDFRLQVPATATSLTVSFVGYAKQTVDITGRNTVTVALKDDAQALGDVVVVGYGTARKEDLTGAISTLGTKDFNKGTFTSPDQLLQGRTSGVQITQNSGQPGGASTIRIRGNSAVTGTGQPLYVVDGVPLDGRSARPGLNTSLGDSPDSNPLNFLNPADIESLTVLKDASATAIYGSRAAYGVVLITTKRGKVGEPKFDFGVSGGFSNILRRIKVLNADQFRQALTYYGAPSTNDLGQNNDPLGAILQTGPLQNYSGAVSGGSESARYRLSLGYLDQKGIVKKTGFQKYTANFVTNAKFLESKRLGVDINITASQSREQLAPITNNGDYRGSLIGQALQWNPTDRLYNDDGTPFVRQGQVINPVAQQQYYNDNARVTTALASISPYYKFTDWLEYRALFATNYSTGIRRTSIDQRLNIQDYQNLGYAAVSTTELQTQQMTHTLNFNKKVTSDLNVNALLGYEYTKFNYSGTGLSGRGPANADGTPIGFGTYGLDYTNYLQYSNPSGRLISSFVDPITELQSFFGRAILNYKDRYLLTATLRADGSTKFGDNNKYGYFPSLSAAWDISQEDFLKSKFESLNQLKLRLGYGRTGNQEFPAGSARSQFVFQSNNGGINQTTNANPNLKWQSDEQYNAGIDVAMFNNRVTLTADYFYKRTTDLLYPNIPGFPAAPGGSSVIWQNLDGIIVNKGVELLLGVTAVDNERFGVSFNANATFVHNNVTGLPAALVIQTGTLSGQGLSGVLSETIQNGQPLNGFYLPTYNGINPATGLYNDFTPASYVGNPNPTAIAGLSATFRFAKLSLITNFNGVFGNKIYNNTFNSVLNVSQIRAGKNISLAEYQSGVKESLANAVTPSTRFLESGNFVKLANVTLSYALGDLGKVFKGASVYAIGQNLFVITKYRGFDPEVNTNKSSGVVPSAGIDYTGYPSARTFTFGLNFSL